MDLTPWVLAQPISPQTSNYGLWLSPDAYEQPCTVPSCVLLNHTAIVWKSFFDQSNYILCVQRCVVFIVCAVFFFPPPPTCPSTKISLDGFLHRSGKVWEIKFIISRSGKVSELHRKSGMGWKKSCSFSIHGPLSFGTLGYLLWNDVVDSHVAQPLSAYIMLNTRQKYSNPVWKSESGKVWNFEVENLKEPCLELFTLEQWNKNQNA